MFPLHPAGVQFLHGCLGGGGGNAPPAPPPCILAARSSSLWGFPPRFLPKFEVDAKGRTEQRVAQAGFSCLAGGCASPAPSPPKKMMLSYPPLLPLPAGWRCLSTTLFSVLAPAEGQRQNPPLEGQKPSKIQAKQILPAALPEYLSLGWPEPSTGKAVVRCCERVPEPSALRSHPQLVASWISPQHHSPGTALSSPQPCAPAVPTHGRERMAPSRQRREEGLNNCCFAGLSPLLAEKGTLLPSRYQPSPSNPLGNGVAEKLSHLIQICFRPTAAW